MRVCVLVFFTLLDTLCVCGSTFHIRTGGQISNNKMFLERTGGFFDSSDFILELGFEIGLDKR